MSTKLKKSTFPTKHSPSDFTCFGPTATKDGEFTNTMLADLGCFSQDDVDSNKYYHGAVVQSKLDQSWYAYFEFGRVGVSNPQFQFISCSSKEEAIEEYTDQMHAKNDKRGQWVNDNVLGKILRPKPGKDCYVVRKQLVRATGLPDAKNIATINTNTVVVSNGPQLDKESQKLLSDLSVAATSYTRQNMVGDALPTPRLLYISM